MSLSRRTFLKASSVAFTCAWVSRSWSLPLVSGLPILQTMTNETTAQFRVLNEGLRRLHYRVRGDDGSTVSIETLDRYIHPAWPDHAVEHLIARGLKVGIDYRLQAIDESGHTLDDRVFRALDRSAGKFAVISCTANAFMEEQKLMWQVVADEAPDLILMIGDAAYLDRRDVSDEHWLWGRHLEVRKALDVFRWPRLIPMVSVWDDHDFGVNNGDQTFPLKAGTRGMFEALFGSASVEGFVRGPSLASEISCFGQRIYLMDDRYYRSPANTPNGTHWGEEQEEWLFSRLGSAPTPSHLMNGSQYFGGYSGYESFDRNHPTQFQRVLQRLSRTEAPVVFHSGDRHLSEIMALEPSLVGYSTMELTSSSLHSFDSKKDRRNLPNPRRVDYTERYNFLMVDSVPSGSGWNVKVRSIGPAREVLFERSQIIRRG